MRVHRELLLGLVVLALGFGAVSVRAEQNKDSNSTKILGKWLTAKGPEKVTLEFMKDGKIRVTIEKEVTKKGAAKSEIVKETIEGSYKLDGNKVTLTAKVEGEEVKRTMTIKTLTDKTLVTEDERGMKEEYRRP